MNCVFVLSASAGLNTTVSVVPGRGFNPRAEWYPASAQEDQQENILPMMIVMRAGSLDYRARAFLPSGALTTRVAVTLALDGSLDHFGLDAVHRGQLGERLAALHHDGNVPGVRALLDEPALERDGERAVRLQVGHVDCRPPLGGRCRRGERQEGIDFLRLAAGALVAAEELQETAGVRSKTRKLGPYMQCDSFSIDCSAIRLNSSDPDS